MPRKAKITAVPIEQPVQEQASVVEAISDNKTDASDVIHEVNVQDQIQQSEVEQPVEPVEQKTPQAKAKRAPTKRVPAAAAIDEAQAETTAPKEEAKEDVKVACPDCGKKMSVKTLKYSHGPNCVAKKPSQESSVSDHIQSAVQSVTEEMIESEVQRRIDSKRTERGARREAMVNKLMQEAF